MGVGVGVDAGVGVGIEVGVAVLPGAVSTVPAVATVGIDRGGVAGVGVGEGEDGGRSGRSVVVGVGARTVMANSESAGEVAWYRISFVFPPIALVGNSVHTSAYLSRAIWLSSYPLD